MNFATCGRCDYVAWVGGILAPPGENVEELRRAIIWKGKGPAVCPQCKLPVMFRMKREMDTRTLDSAQVITTG